MALERLPNLSNFLHMEALYLSNCNKLAEILGLDKLLNFISEIQMERCSNLTNNFKQSILQEWTLSGFRSLYGIFLPDNDIPDWFTYKDEGRSICFEVPRIIDHNMEGFAVCTVHSSCDNGEIWYAGDLPIISVLNKTKSTTYQNERRFNITLEISHEDHIWIFNFDKYEVNLEAGDEVEVIADFGPEIDVKKIGVRLVYTGILMGK
ncbi:uncharacterized protein LOC132183379 [Corylus avellana]|uniref:uncharacterized protein LOC132183379 n=1 Tax=Corylus avellana TaxID=13451 RepID=UPI00286C8A11|nr:uncharacterized protein LOC132183379 [Corylus avellana]